MSDRTAQAHEQWLAKATLPTRILIIEDDELLVELFLKVLADYNADPVIVNDGTEAVALVQQETPSFDLVILDYMLPGGRSGFQVLGALMKARPVLPIIIFSGYITTAMIMEVSSLGLVAFAYKPSLATMPALHRLIRLVGVKPLKPVPSQHPFP